MGRTVDTIRSSAFADLTVEQNKVQLLSYFRLYDLCTEGGGGAHVCKTKECDSTVTLVTRH